jgi:hypothetical protein
MKFTRMIALSLTFLSLMGSAVGANSNSPSGLAVAEEAIAVTMPGWQKFPALEERFTDYAYSKNKTGGIRNFFLYSQPGMDYQSFALFVVVHGTFAQDSTEFYDEDNMKFHHVLRYAQAHAEQHNVPTGVLVFAWTGINDLADRVNGGSNLAYVLNSLNKVFTQDMGISNFEVHTLAHSHGCNLVNAASTKLDKLVIKHIVNLATPVREVVDREVLKPTNYEKLTQFYSTSDLVAAAGSVNFSLRGLAAMFSPVGSIRKFTEQFGRNTYNVRTQIDASDPGHSGIIAVIPYLHDINNIIDTNYAYHTDLDLNVDTQKALANDPVLISARKKVSYNDLIAQLKQKKIFSKLSTLPTAKQTLRTVKADIKNEQTFSAQQEQMFSNAYGFNMHDKGYVFTRFLGGAKAEIAANLPEWMKPSVPTWIKSWF